MQDTVTGGDTQTEQSQSSGALAESGSYSNSSYSVSSYALSESGSDTITSASSDTFTSSSAGTTSGTESVDMWTAYNGSGSFTRGGNGSRQLVGDADGQLELGGTGWFGRRQLCLVVFWFFATAEQQRVVQRRQQLVGDVCGDRRQSDVQRQRHGQQQRHAGFEFQRVVGGVGQHVGRQFVVERAQLFGQR